MENRLLEIQARKISQPSLRFLLMIPLAIAVAAVAWYGSRPMLDDG